MATALVQCTWLAGFYMLMTYAILLINPGHWQQAKMQQPIGVVRRWSNYNYPIHVNALKSAKSVTLATKSL